ncbi:MAG: protein kinase [Bryobacteraceae bacterium]
MQLSTGSRLGPYEIVTRIGEGGMGEVYKARDTRLERIVAIKVSKSQFSERFAREAKIISSLNHPNICALYDVGEQDGLHYLVMEYLEGTPLEGPLPFEKLVRYGMEIGAALDAAHRKGVTHRDLKPANVMITAAGVKLLDFGLAKTASTPGPMDATVPKALTSEGTIMGTFQYMSPEQLEGEEADARSDIWAYGAVLYEMATGRQAFEGKTHATLIANIMHTQPAALDQVQPSAPAGLDRLIRRAMAKDAEERWQSARDMVLELRDLRVVAGGEKAIPVAGTAKWKIGTVFFAVTTVIVGAMLIWNRAPLPDPVHLEIHPPPGYTLPAGIGAHRISPDGRTIMLVLRGPAGRRIHIRRLASPEPVELAGTDGATYGAWSPDSKSIAFLARGKLKRLDLGSGGSYVLADAARVDGVAWAPGNVILMGQTDGPILRVAPAGGAPAPVTQLDASNQERSHQGPFFLPDGKRFLFRVSSEVGGHSGIFAGSLDGGAPKRLNVPNATRTFGGFLFFPRDEDGWAQRLDLRTLEGQGNPIQLGHGATTASLSENGTLIYTSRGEARGGVLHVVDREGAVLAAISTSETSGFGHPEFSPDGKRLVLDSEGSLWIADVERKTITRLTYDSATGPGTWTADSKRILYSAGGKLLSIAASGGEPVTEGEGDLHHMHLFADGKQILADSVAGGGPGPLFHATLGGTTVRLFPEPGGQPASLLR